MSPDLMQSEGALGGDVPLGGSGASTRGSSIRGSWTRSRRLRRAGAHALFLAVIFGLWELLSGPVVDSFWVSSPIAIADASIDWAQTAEFWTNLKVTMVEVLLGFVIGATGIVLGFLLGEFRRADSFLDPYLTIGYGIPKTALAPLFILWFGIGLWAKVMMGAAMVFFLVLFPTIAGLRSVDPDLLNMARVGGASRLQVLTKVKIPTAFPYVMTGIKVGLPASLIGVIVAEYISSNEGIGYLLVRAGNFFNTAQLFAGILILALIVFLLNWLVVTVERYVLRWRPTDD